MLDRIANRRKVFFFLCFIFNFLRRSDKAQRLRLFDSALACLSGIWQKTSFCVGSYQFSQMKMRKVRHKRYMYMACIEKILYFEMRLFSNSIQTLHWRVTAGICINMFSVHHTLPTLPSPINIIVEKFNISSESKTMCTTSTQIKDYLCLARNSSHLRKKYFAKFQTQKEEGHSSQSEPTILKLSMVFQKHCSSPN